MKKSLLLGVGFCFFMMSHGATACAQSSTRSVRREVAVTFDDLPEASSTDAKPADDEAQIYVVVLKAWYVESTKYIGERARLLVLHEESYAQLNRFSQYRDDMRGVSRDTLDDFHARNKRPSPLVSKLDLGVKVLFIAGREYKALVPVKRGSSEWGPFYAKYPEAAGVIFLSRAGFNGGRTEALVEVGRGCGLGCGEGAFVFLRKDGGSWKVSESYGGWMS
jgi:hypothetical protein